MSHEQFIIKYILSYKICSNYIKKNELPLKKVKEIVFLASQIIALSHYYLIPQKQPREGKYQAFKK